MIDLTRITTPFGLLDPETQEALKAHGGPYEFWNFYGRWQSTERCALWQATTVYRVKAAPPKPREWWAVGKHLHDTESDAISFRQACADHHGSHHLRTPIVHVREVLE